MGRKGASTHDIMMSHQTSHKEGGFFKKARKAFPMFPFTENRMKGGDYGELIQIEDFRQHETVEGDALALSTLANRKLFSDFFTNFVKTCQFLNSLN